MNYYLMYIYNLFDLKEICDNLLCNKLLLYILNEIKEKKIYICIKI